MQDSLYAREQALGDAHARDVDTKDEFYRFFTPANSAKPEIHGGFARAHWCGSRVCEEQIKNDLKVTIRCIPFDTANENGACIFCQAPSSKRVVFAKSY